MLETFERDYGIHATLGWGMTETITNGSLGRPATNDDHAACGSGQRLFGVRMKLVDEHGQRLPHDGRSAGELHVKGATVIRGYYRDDDASGEAFDDDGWLATGDMATLGDDGELAIVDRVKDLIKSGGEWISSLDMENLANAHPGVRECAVIAVPDSKWGERPLLIVVPQAGHAPGKDDLLAHLRDRFAAWQLPDDVVFVAELPHTATGKIAKRLLRDRHGQRAPG